MSATVKATTKGGVWLIEDVSPDAVFTPARLSAEHRMIAKTTEEFVAAEVLARLDQLEQKDWTLARRLIARCGELGLLGTDVPEAYGGVELDKAASIVIAERIAGVASFGASFGAQTGLAIMPLLCFGTDAQRQQYLGDLVSGRRVGAYALSESGAGSDALGAKTRATVQPDGSYLLNGEKMWITNGGFADIFIVFAKVGGEQFTAFVVERGFPGVASGKEEHKMGLHGSSTTPLVLQDAQVPAENLLGDVGKGHKVAFNILNYGRLKLGAMCSGGGKLAIGEAARYAAERRQFGRPIGEFGAIKHKLGEMIIRAYAVESMLYRTTGLIDTMLADQDPHDGDGLLGALEEFAVESSILKVAGSEMLDFVLDENIQVHGGNGFVRDYPAERHFRDARVNRIFEGTNEINRLLIPGMLVRRALKGTPDLIPAAKALQDEILTPVAVPAVGTRRADAERRAVAALKKTCLMLLGTAMQRFGDSLAEHQEVLTFTADAVIDTFAAESAVLRALQTLSDERSTAELEMDLVRALISDAVLRVGASATQAVAAMAAGDALRTQLAVVRRLLNVTPVDTVAVRRRLADAAVARGAYPLQ